RKTPWRRATSSSWRSRNCARSPPEWAATAASASIHSCVSTGSESAKPLPWGCIWVMGARPVFDFRKTRASCAEYSAEGRGEDEKFRHPCWNVPLSQHDMLIFLGFGDSIACAAAIWQFFGDEHVQPHARKDEDDPEI